MLPTATLHGINGNCDQDMMKQVARVINETFPDNPPHVECIDPYPNNPNFNSIFVSANHQVEDYCNLLKNHPIFGKSDINIVGMSQGALFARSLVETCDFGEYKVRHLLSVGGP